MQYSQKKKKKKNPNTEWELVKFKKKLQSKETTDKMKRQPTE